MKNKIFLSYTSKDSKFVERLSNDLESHGIKVWKFERDLLPGMPIWPKINDKIFESKCVGVILSENSVTSKGVRLEINNTFRLLGDREDPFIIPILRTPIKANRIPKKLRGLTWADFSKSYFLGLECLLKVFGKDTTQMARQDIEYLADSNLFEMLCFRSLKLIYEISKIKYIQLIFIGQELHGNRCVVAADTIPDGQFRYRLVSMVGLIGKCIQKGETVKAINVYDVKDYLKAEEATHSELVIPIISSKLGIIGAINFESEMPEYIENLDVKRLGNIVKILGDIIEKNDWLPRNINGIPSMWFPDILTLNEDELNFSRTFFADSIEHIQSFHDRLPDIPQYQDIRIDARIVHAKYLHALGFTDRSIQLLKRVPEFAKDKRIDQAIDDIKDLDRAKQI